MVCAEQVRAAEEIDRLVGNGLTEPQTADASIAVDDVGTLVWRRDGRSWRSWGAIGAACARTIPTEPIAGRAD